MRLNRIFCFAYAATLSIATGASAADAPADPDVFKTPPNWKVEVLAKAPDIQHPSVVTTSPDSRIFFGEDPIDMYLPSDAAADRIVCLHPDGHKTVFAEKLHAVYGLAYIDGKLIVHHPPFVSVFTDDDSGIATKRVDLITRTNPNPWATGGFNDHIPSNFRLAMDGYLYMTTGDKGIFGAVGTDGSKAELRGGGILRLRPDGSHLEVYSTGTRNHLDAAMNAEDELFTYDNTDDGRGWWTRYTHMVDGGYYGYPWDYWPPDATPEKVQKQIETGTPGRPYTLWRMAEYGGGSPCGAVSYSEDALPPEYRENNFHCEWGKGKLERFIVKRTGGTYSVVKRDDTFLLPGGQFRPVGICVTHDGTGFLITDWNYAGWKNAENGGKVGRLLRMTYTGAMNPAPKPDWFVAAGTGKPFTAPTEQLLNALKHPARSVRMVAERRLAERGEEAFKPLVALLQNETAPAYARWHAIWTLDAMDGGLAARPQIVATFADKSVDASVRRQAARQLGNRRASAAVRALIDALKDSDESIRFQAATSLGRIGDKSAVPALLEASGTDKDLFAHYAMFHALNRIGRADGVAWASILDGFSSENADVRAATGYAVREMYDPQLTAALAAFAQDAKNSAESRSLALAAMAPVYLQPKPWDGKWWATQPVLSPPPAKELDWAGTKAISDAIVAGLKEASPVVRLAAIDAAETSRDPAAGDPLAEMFRTSAGDNAMRAHLLRALAATKPQAAAEFVGDVLKDASTTDAALVPDAIAVAEKIGSPDMRRTLVGAMNRDASPDALAQIAAALGRLKEKQAVTALARASKDADAKVAIASIESLAQIGGDDSVAGVLPALADSRTDVRRAAIVALGKLASLTSVEPLLKSAKDPQFANDTIVALAATPDVRALDAYLDGLASPDANVREHSHLAVRAISVAALPLIEKRIESPPALPAQAISELQHIYSKPQPIAQWTVVGPFARAAAPPFDVAAPPTSGDFAGIKGPAKWKKPKADTHGMVDLTSMFHPNENVAAYAIAHLDSPFDREAEFLTGSDDSMTLWINGQQVLDDNADSGWGEEEQRFKAKLRAGDNIVVAKVGNSGGGWQFSVAAAGHQTGKLFEYDTTKLDPAKYAAFASTHPGDASRGNAIFHNINGVACVKCHKTTATGEGGEVGPSLAGVGAKYQRDQLIESVLYPSKQIFDGYQQTLIRTKAGKLLAGSIRGETEADITLLDAAGVKTIVKKSDISRRKVSELSLMPEGLHQSLKPEEFADLIAYLQGLKDK